MTPFLIGPGSVRYSSVRASNGKWLLLQIADGFNQIRSINGHYSNPLPAIMNHSAQVVFSRTNPDLLYYCAANRLMFYEIGSQVSGVVMEFPEYLTLASNHAEGDLSEAGFLALCGVRPDGVEEICRAHLPSATKGPVYPQSEPFDGIKAAGDHILLSKRSGIWDLTTGVHVCPSNGHACPAVYQGRDVLLYCNAAENPVVRPEFPNAVMMVNISDGSQVGLKSFDWRYALHISRDIVSVYDPSGQLPFQIWHVQLDGTEGQMLFEWTGPYDANFQPRATVSADGTLILFNRWDGTGSYVWGIRLGGDPAGAVETRIDYSSYVGKSEFVLRPRADGAVDVFERKL